MQINIEIQRNSPRLYRSLARVNGEGSVGKGIRSKNIAKLFMWNTSLWRPLFGDKPKGSIHNLRTKENPTFSISEN